MLKIVQWTTAFLAETRPVTPPPAEDDPPTPKTTPAESVAVAPAATQASPPPDGVGEPGVKEGGAGEEGGEGGAREEGQATNATSGSKGQGELLESNQETNGEVDDVGEVDGGPADDSGDDQSHDDDAFSDPHVQRVSGNYVDGEMELMVLHGASIALWALALEIEQRPDPPENLDPNWPTIL